MEDTMEQEMLVVCQHCKKVVRQGNFCERCGGKLKEVCDCWIKKEPYNCGQGKCPGYRLLVMALMEELCKKNDEQTMEKQVFDIGLKLFVIMQDKILSELVNAAISISEEEKEKRPELVLDLVKAMDGYIPYLDVLENLEQIFSHEKKFSQKETTRILELMQSCLQVQDAVHSILFRS